MTAKTTPAKQPDTFVKKVYLDEPITLYGIKVSHTYEGLKFLIAHYTRCLKNARPDQISDKDRAHALKRIEDFKIDLALYERQRSEQPSTAQPHEQNKN